MFSSDLDAVLDSIAPEAPAAVARGRLALAEALSWMATTEWPEVAERFSVLAEGSPLELVWRPEIAGLFWTAEPAAPELAPAERLARALNLFEAISGCSDQFFRRRAERLASLVAMPWPIWLAGRHTDAGDAAKLYFRVSGYSDEFEPLRAQLRGTDQPVMIGMSSAGECELYWKRHNREPGDLWRLSNTPELAPLTSSLNAALIAWDGSGLDDPRGRRLGLSLQFDARGRAKALAAFMRVDRTVCANRIQARLLNTSVGVEPALARCWTQGLVRPMLLSLVATLGELRPAIGLRLR